MNAVTLKPTTFTLTRQWQGKRYPRGVFVTTTAGTVAVTSAWEAGRVLGRKVPVLKQLSLFEEAV